MVPLLLHAEGRYYAFLDLQSFAVAVIALVVAVALVRRVGERGGEPYLSASWRREGPLAVFAVLVAASWAVAHAPTASLRDLLGWSQALLLFLAVRVAIRSSSDLRRAYTGVAAVGLLLAAHFVYHVALGAWFALPRNVLAAVLLPPLFAGLALCFDERPPVRWLAGRLPVAIVGLALLLTRSRAAWLGLALGGGVVLVPAIWREGRARGALRFAAVAILVSLALGAVATGISYRRGITTPVEALLSLRRLDRGSAEGRLRRWTNGLALVAERPLLGSGPGNWTEVYPRHRDAWATDVGGDPLPYGSWVGLAAEVGVPACAALVAFFGSLLLGWRGPGRSRPPPEERLASCTAAALLALLVMATFHDVLRNRLLLALVFATAGSLASLDPGRRGPAPFVVRGVVTAIALVVGFSVVAEYRHLRASLHYGLLVDRASFAGVGRRLVPLGLPSPLDELARWYFGALEGPADQLLPVFASERTIRPRSAPLWIAHREVEAGECGDAGPWIEHVLDASPHPEGWLLRGRCERLAGRLEDALAASDAGLRLNARVPELHALRGDLLRDLGRLREAMDAYRAAERIHRDRLGRRFGTSSLSQAQKDVDALGRLARQRRALREDLGLERRSFELVGAIADTPLLHKGLAQRGDALLFASNLAGDFDLFEVDLDPARRSEGTAPRPRRDSAARILTRDHRARFRPRAHPDGERIYFVSDADGDYRYALYERSLVNGSDRRLTPPFAGREAEFELAPDGRTIVVKREWRGEHDLFLVDTETRRRRRLTSDGRTKSDLAIGPRGAAVAWVEDGRRIVVLDTGSGKRRVRGEGEDVLRWPRFAPDGRLAWVAAAASPDGRSVLWRTDPRGEPRPLATSEGAWLEPLWTGRERLVARERVADEYRLVEIDVAAGRRRPVGPATGVVYPPVLLADGARLAYAYAGAAVPPRLETLDLRTGRRDVVLRLEDFVPDEMLAHQILEGPGGRSRTYLHLPRSPTEGRVPAVLWLHGATADFSPRWHPYAQAFAHAGFAFAAPNVEPGGDAAAEIVAVLDRLAARADIDPQRIFAVGVSSGTRIVHDVLERRADAFAAVAEYSPIPDAAWTRPRDGLPPFAVFLVANDPGLNVAERVARLEAQRGVGTRVEWTVLPDEGHDLRHRDRVRRRLDATLAFFESVPPPEVRAVHRRALPATAG